MLFPPKQVNRRMTAIEQQHDDDIAKLMKRPPKHMLLDVPYYPWTKIEPLVNFALRFKE